MIRTPSRIALACMLPMLLTSCLLTPGKFISDLTIRADRSFAFSYKGEVITADLSQAAPLVMTPDTARGSTAENQIFDEGKAAKSLEREQKYRAMATFLSREAGYRSATYKGKGVFLVDYAITGLLTSNFVFPFNSDAEALVPFIAIEVRKDGTVRMRAPAFGRSPAPAGMAAMLPGFGGTTNKAEGSFTLTTDAEIVMHNEESGVRASGPDRTIQWTVGASEKDAPTAVLRMKN